MMHENSCGWRSAAIINDPIMAIKKIADGDPIPSSPNCKAVPTITAIITSAYKADRICANNNCVENRDSNKKSVQGFSVILEPPIVLRF